MVSTAQDIMRRYGIDQDFAVSIETLGNDLGVDQCILRILCMLRVVLILL